MGWHISAEHLDVATRTVREHLAPTPMVRSSWLSSVAGADVWLKLETEQLTGSFKVRGALVRVSALGPHERSLGVVAASAGNHGLGVAFAARALGTTARVHVPSGTPGVKREGIAALGAELVVSERSGYDDVEVEARRDAQASGRVFVSPFDHPLVAAGNGGSLFDEILGELPGLASVVLPVGGGGLLAGAVAARDRVGAHVTLVGVQSDACPAMARSLSEGRAITRMSGARTLAEGLEGGVGESTFEAVAAASDVRVATVSEAAIAFAMMLMHRHEGVRIEGSAAVAPAFVESGARGLRSPIVVVITGGNVDEPTFADAERMATLYTGSRHR